jgi:hypothetical protein
MVRYTEKYVKFETHYVGHGIWQETVKNDEYEKYTTVGPELWKVN